MEIISWKNTLSFTGPLLCAFAYKLLKGRKEIQCESADINEVLFYGAKEGRETKVIGLRNLFCIYYVISHATRTVDICVPSFESAQLTRCLIDVHHKNKIKIRVAIHNSNEFSNLKTLSENGIKVKVIRSKERLEHEFLLIDAADGQKGSLAVIGSLDYEATRLNCNRDNTIMTNEPQVVVNLNKEFNRIWNYKPEMLG